MGSASACEGKMAGTTGSGSRGGEKGGALSPWLMFLHLLAYAGFVVAQCVWWMFQGMMWYCTGVSQQLWASRRPEGYYFAAHVEEVVFRFKFDEFFGSSKKMDFMLVHRGFVDPRYLLKDNVTIYDINEHEAVFVEADEGIQMWRSELGSFVRLTQFHRARRIITLPIDHFNRFAEELGDPIAPLIFIPNVGRCGSTLLAQIFEATDRCVVYSEPDVLPAVRFFPEKVFSQEIIARNVIRVLCKPVSSPRRIDAYVFKPQAPATDCVNLYGRLFSRSKHLFMWRNAKDAASSLEKLLYTLPTFYLPQLLPTVLNPIILAACRLKMGKHSTIADEDFLGMIRYPLIAGILTFGQVMSKYIVFHADGEKVAGVRYEDIIEDPHQAISQIFQYCNLEESLVQRSLRALERDSQCNSLFSKAQLSRIQSRCDWTPEVIASADRMLARYNLPGVLEDFSPPGIVTQKRISEDED